MCWTLVAGQNRLADGRIKPEMRDLQPIGTRRFGSIEWSDDRFMDDYPSTGPFVRSLSHGHETIKTMALVKMEIVRYNHSVYVFIPAEGKWVMARSVVAARYLADVLGLPNVSVNYPAAVAPYLDYVAKVARHISDLPLSVCIGTWRLGVGIEEALCEDYGAVAVRDAAVPQMPRIDTPPDSAVMDSQYADLEYEGSEASDGSSAISRRNDRQTAPPDYNTAVSSCAEAVEPETVDIVRFMPYGRVAPLGPYLPGAARVSSFCVCPVESTSIPRCTQVERGLSAGELILSNVLSKEDLQLLMWVIGNGLVDPPNRPRSVLLYGPGGDGKTTTIRTISECLRGTVHMLSQDYSSGSKPVSTDDIVGCMTSRFVCYGDMELKSDSINASFWKMITGGDAVTAQGMTSTVSCTGIFGSNYLWYPNAQTRKPWFMRRMIAIVMTPLPKGCARPQSEFSDDEVTDFVCSAVATRLRFGTDPPLTTKHVLITMFGYRVGVATRGIVEKPDASDMECQAAMFSMSIASLIDYDQLIRMAESMAPHMVKDLGFTKVIKGLSIGRAK